MVKINYRKLLLRPNQVVFLRGSLDTGIIIFRTNCNYRTSFYLNEIRVQSRTSTSPNLMNKSHYTYSSLLPRTPINLCISYNAWVLLWP